MPLPLERIYDFERTRADQPYLTQPLPGGTLLEWTWHSAMQEIRKLAAYLKAQGWPQGSRVVILSKNCAWWIMADFAIWMAGYVSVPFYPLARDASLASLFAHAEPVACFLGALDQPLVCEDPAMHDLTYILFPGASAASMPEQHIVPWPDVVRDQEAMLDSPTRPGDEVATIIYTSGTTGKPKGVMQSFLALILMGKSLEPVNALKLGHTERVISYLPLAHVAERAITEMQSIVKPTHIYFTAGLESFQQDLKRARVTAFFSVPRLYIRFQQGVFQQMPEKKLRLLLRLPIVRRIVGRKVLAGLGLADAVTLSSGGAAMPLEVVRWYRKLGANFVEGYGMTETGITHIPLRGQFRAGRVGTTSPYAETRIADNGEVQIKGQMLMRGYYRNPELTAEVFTADGFFHTGDRGEIDEQGRLRLIGRLKEEFKTSKGKYVMPTQIENTLATAGLFEAVAVFGEGMTSPFAITVLTPIRRQLCEDPEHRPHVAAELRQALQVTNAQLEHHEQLSFLVVCAQPWTPENGYMTATLKVRRALIESKLMHAFNAWEKSAEKVVWIESLCRPPEWSMERRSRRPGTASPARK